MRRSLIILEERRVWSFRPYSWLARGQPRVRAPKPGLLNRRGTPNPSIPPHAHHFPALRPRAPSHIRFRIRALPAFGFVARRQS